MMILNDLLKDFYAFEEKGPEENVQYLFLESIRPEDIPHRDRSQPKPEPNKRVIIIDI